MDDNSNLPTAQLTDIPTRIIPAIEGNEVLKNNPILSNSLVKFALMAFASISIVWITGYIFTKGANAAGEK